MASVHNGVPSNLPSCLSGPRHGIDCSVGPIGSSVAHVLCNVIVAISPMLENSSNPSPP